MKTLGVIEVAKACWRRGGLPLFSSLLLWMASPGDVGLWVLIFVGFIPLLFFLEKSFSHKTSLSTLFFAGLFHGVLLAFFMLYWIVNVLITFGGLPLVAAILTLLLLGLYMACYPAIFLVLARPLVVRGSPAALLVVLPSLWTGLEWLRGLLFTGFPWMDVGCYLAFQPSLLQGAALFGHHGLTWLLVFCNVALWMFCSRQFTQSRVKIGLLVVLIAGAYTAYSLVIFQQQRVEQAENVRVGVVQGNVAQDVKWSPAAQQETVEKYFALSKKLITAFNPPDFLVWPETAMPFYPQQSALTTELLSFVRAWQIPLISGAPWYNVVDKESGIVEYYNAAFLLSPFFENPLKGLVFKSHLVPFGEYIPFSDFLPFLEPLVQSAGNFTAGEIKNPLQIKTSNGEFVQVGVLICFESVFPDLSRRWVDVGANLFINITNDAWYGKTSAPTHTLAMTVLRAIETRRTIVRAANTGFSAFISPAGEIQQRTELFVPAAFAGDLSLRKERSVYVLWGWMFAPFCLLIALGSSFWSMRKIRNSAVSSL